jgi:hypothetical protein
VQTRCFRKPNAKHEGAAFLILLSIEVSKDVASAKWAMLLPFETTRPFF